jgi:hypothetical protein
VYQVNTLGEDDSKQIVFPRVMSPELEQGSEALLKKCDGLPLALVCVSDYLKSSSEPTGELCEKLSRNMGSHLKENHNMGSHLKENHGHDSFSELRRVLHDSYESLSSYALTCMLYLGIFPNNHSFKRKVVIRRWLAEGYARSDSICSEQDIADDNFDKLIDLNIIQPVEMRCNSQVKRCKVHGVMHEFAVHKSMSQRFIAMSSRDHPRVGVDSNNSRHLSVHAGEVMECVGSDEALSRVRSLTVFGNAGDALSYVSKCKLIRVLDLEECNDLEADSLKYICKLWHLKYLSLGGTICEFPRRCLEGLHCLETLDLRRTKVKILPVEAIQLPHLAHLFGELMLDENDLKNEKKMSNLRKFLSGNKSNLQTLAGFVTDGSKGLLQLMGHMKKLGKVKMWCREPSGTSNLISDLSQAIQQFTKVPIDRANNRSLSLDCHECSENFLSSLDLEPCSDGSKYDLRSLKLNGKLLQLPPFVTLLPGLTELYISTSMLTSDLLSELASFKRLLYLKLVAIQIETFKFEKGAFPSLRRLCFVVQRLTTALPTIEQGALLNLVSLQLLCQGLIGLSDIEIRNFRHLKEIVIDSKVTPDTKQNWERAAKNHPNRPKVLFPTTSDPFEGEELEPCATREKRKRCATQSSDEGLDSTLKKMRLSEDSSFLPVIAHQGAVMGTQASSSIPGPS